MKHTQHRPVAALALLATACAVTCLLVRLTSAARHPAHARFDDALVALSGWLLVGCAGWAVLLCLAAAVEAVTASRVRATAWVACPTVVRRTLVAVVGVGLAGAASGPAVAETLPTPARPVERTASSGPLRVTVRAGDTLWGLASDRLGPSATAAEVADLVARTHRRNHAVIGPDPDFIQPGQRLALPLLPHRAHRRPSPTPHLEEKP